MDVQLERVRAFRAQTPARNGRFGIAFDRDQLSILVIDELSATNPAVGTNRGRDLRAIVLGTQIARAFRHGFRSSAIDAGFNLLDERPAGKQIIEHSLPPRTSPKAKSTNQFSDDSSRASRCYHQSER